MVHRNGEYDGKEYIFETFETIDEFIREVESRPLSDTYSFSTTAQGFTDASYDSHDRRFRGVSGYDEAKKQFIEGTKAAVEMSKAFASEVDPRQREAANSPCGCVPIVANALRGIPDSMVDIRRKRIPKATRLVVDMTVHCGISCSDIIRAGKQIIAAVGKLEGQGISTEIMCTVDSLMCGNVLTGMGVTIKNAGQGFSAARVSFPMSSPAFLRVFSLMHTSRLKGCPYDAGYGRPLANSYSDDKLRDYYRTMYGNGIYISLARVINRGEYEINNAIDMWRKGR